MSVNELLSALPKNYLNIKCNSLNFGDDSLSKYDLSTVALAYSGPFAAPVNSNVSLTRIGNSVIAHFTGFSSAVNSSTIITSSALPADFRPVVTSSYDVIVTDNSANVRGVASISTAGVMTLSVNISSNFQNSGNGGFVSFSLCFNVA